MASPNPIVELAQRCVERLEACRAAGESSYPVPLDQLLAEAAGPITTYSDAQRARAVKHASFRQRCFVAHPKHPDAPVVLVEDLAEMAASPKLFQFACRHVPGGPPWLAADLKKAVAKPLQAAFDQALRSRATAMAESSVAIAARVAFSADERLELQILSVLGRPMAAPFPTLRQLAELAGLSPLKLASRLKKLASSARFLAHAAPLLDKHLDSPIAVRAEADGMARRAVSIELLVRTARTDKKRLIARKELLKKASASVRPAVQAFLEEQLAAGGSLGAVAAIRDGREWKFFLLDDLEPTAVRWRLTSTPTNGESPADLATFAAQLAMAFDRLDGESGGHNQVSLRQLRTALPAWERAAFDSRLSSLRQSGEYTLSGMQHRGGVSPEDQEAGIREGGVLRIFLSRLRSRDLP